MSKVFEDFGRTPLGERLSHLIDMPDRYVEFRAFSRAGLPAVTALVATFSPILEPLRSTNPADFDKAKRFTGWATAAIMRRHDHVIIRKSASVPGTLFSVGAVWSGDPSTSQPIAAAEHDRSDNHTNDNLFARIRARFEPFGSLDDLVIPSRKEGREPPRFD